MARKRATSEALALKSGRELDHLDLPEDFDWFTYDNWKKIYKKVK